MQFNTYSPEKLHIPDQPGLKQALLLMKENAIPINEKVVNFIREGKRFDRSVGDKVRYDITSNGLAMKEYAITRINDILVSGCIGDHVQIRGEFEEQKYVNVDDAINLENPVEKNKKNIEQPQKEVKQSTLQKIYRAVINFFRNLFNKNR